MLLSLSIACALLVAPQDAQEGTRPTFKPPTSSSTHEPGPGAKLVPGVLPKKTSKEARALWERACAAAVAPEAERQKVVAFQLTFQILTRGGSRGSRGSNETEARFLYLDAAGFVRTSLKSGREHVLGPDGPFLIDGKRTIPLTKTRENAEDLRQIDETVSIARNFLALTDPSSLRIGSMAVLATPPPGLPADLSARAAALRWLDVTSPDFLLMRPPEGVRPDALFRVRLGLDPQTGRVEQAVIGDDRGPLADTSVLVELQDVAPLDGFLVPGRLFVYEIDQRAPRRQFVPLPTVELWRVPPGTLRPTLTPDDFRP